MERGLAFTIDRARARELASRLRLGHHCDFVLKFLQAAHQAADGLTIRGARTFEFWGWRGGELGRVSERIHSPFSLEQDDGLGSLAVGLSALVADHQLELEYWAPGHQGRRVVLQCSDGGQESTPEVLLERPRELGPGQSLLRLRVNTEKQSWKVGELEEYLLARAPWGRVRFCSEEARPASHTLSALCGRKVGQFVPPDAQWQEQLDCWFVVSPQRMGQFAKIRLMSHGLILEERTYPARVGPTVTVCADHLPTDLSGLQFIDCDDKTQLVDAVLQQLACGTIRGKSQGKRYHAYALETIAMLSFLCVTCGIQLFAACQTYVMGGDVYVLQLCDALLAASLVPLVEFHQHIRFRRQLRPWPRRVRFSLTMIAALWLLGYLFLAAGSSAEFRPRWFIPQLFTPALLPLVLDFMLNPSPRAGEEVKR